MLTTATIDAARTSRKGASARKCLSCGQLVARDQELRLCCGEDGVLVVDWKGNLGGRGAHVCAKRSCLVQLVRRRAADRALKRQVSYPTEDELFTSIELGSERQLETLLRSGGAARIVVAGADAVDQAIAAGRVSCLIVANDSALRERAQMSARSSGVPLRIWMTKEKLGELLGRPATGIVAVLEKGLAAAILRVLARHEGLERSVDFEGAI